MGVVYKARDTGLDTLAALEREKVATSAFSARTYQSSSRAACGAV
jgi:hypothetical protein